jgi:hypothetical protein
MDEAREKKRLGSERQMNELRKEKKVTIGMEGSEQGRT